MDVQNDTEVEVDFQVQGGPLGGRPPELVRLGFGQRKTVDIGGELATVVFFSTQPQAGGRPKVLDIVRNVQQDQIVNLTVQAVVNDLPAVRRRCRGD